MSAISWQIKSQGRLLIYPDVAVISEKYWKRISGWIVEAHLLVSLTNLIYSNLGQDHVVRVGPFCFNPFRVDLVEKIK